jgi:hypothetical protein
MAVCDRHDFAAFAALCRADTRAHFFAPLKLASMKDSLRSSFPRSRKSSASFCSKRNIVSTAQSVESVYEITSRERLKQHAKLTPQGRFLIILAKKFRAAGLAQRFF